MKETKEAKNAARNKKEKPTDIRGEETEEKRRRKGEEEEGVPKNNKVFVTSPI